MANSGRVLITGATGKVGSALLDNLANDDIELRALAHDESEAKSLEGRGAEAVLGDFLEPETLRPALEGVGRVFLLTPIHPQQVHQATNVIEAARAARRIGMSTVGLAGYDGGAMAACDSFDVVLVVDSDSVHRVQEAHSAMIAAIASRPRT